jgi:hypothetical protein
LQRSPGKQDRAMVYVGRLARMIGLESTCKRVRRFKGDINPNRVYQYSLPSSAINLAILGCIERRYAKFSNVPNIEAETLSIEGIELDPITPSLLKKEAVGGSESLPVVGQVLQCGDTEYRVKGIREVEGVVCFVLEYVGYEYLPVFMRCDEFWGWRKGQSRGGDAA